MSNPKISFASAGNIYIRSMHFENIGDINEGHSHPYDHLTLLATGSLKVTVENNISTFKAPHIIYIAKDKQHTLEALEPNTVVYCINALRNKDTQDILDPAMIPSGIITPEIAANIMPVARK